MEYIIGVGLGLGLMVFAMIVGFDSDRAFYPTVLIIVASYYVLFALGSGPALGWEMLILGLFVTVSVIGFKRNLWLVVGALFTHGVLDSLQGKLIFNPGVPAGWPAFCLSFDVTAAFCLAARLSGLGSAMARSRRREAKRPATASDRFPLPQIEMVQS